MGVTGRGLTPRSARSAGSVSVLAWQTPTSQPGKAPLGPTASPAHGSPEQQLHAKITRAANTRQPRAQPWAGKAAGMTQM